MKDEFAICFLEPFDAGVLVSISVITSPCILFFDEIESVFKNRRKEESESGVSQKILTQLLLQIDNLHNRKSQDFVFVIGATNLPEVGIEIIINVIATGPILIETRKTG